MIFQRGQIAQVKLKVGLIGMRCSIAGSSNLARAPDFGLARNLLRS
jgi:hypothetical protein